MKVNHALKQLKKLRSAELRPDSDDVVCIHPGCRPAGHRCKGRAMEMRRSLGTAVFSGMIGVTLFGIFLTPVFFYVIEGWGESRLFSSPITHRVSLAVLILAGIGVLEIPALGISKGVRFAALIVAVLAVPAVWLVRSQFPSARGASSPTQQTSKEEKK